MSDRISSLVCVLLLVVVLGVIGEAVIGLPAIAPVPIA